MRDEPENVYFSFQLNSEVHASKFGGKLKESHIGLLVEYIKCRHIDKLVNCIQVSNFNFLIYNCI